MLINEQSPKANAPPRHSIVFFAGLPLKQTYASLQNVFMQSKILTELRDGNITKEIPQYINELEKLVVSREPFATFGDGQLNMWQRSAVTLQFWH
jgi:hypothetical protein